MVRVEIRAVGNKFEQRFGAKHAVASHSAYRAMRQTASQRSREEREEQSDSAS